MKILQVITGLRRAAGTSTFCGEVCNQLVALGHDVTIAVVNSEEPDRNPLDPRVHLVSIESLLHVSPPPSSPSLSVFSPYTLVHVHGLWTPILHRVSCWAHQQSMPVVWSTHGMTAPWALKHKWWKKFLPWYLYQRRDLTRARLIHCTSDFEVEWNRRLGFNRVFLAPLGTFLAKEYVERTGGDGLRNFKVLLFVGRIYPVKALDRLIEAFALAASQFANPSFHSQWRLRLVGPDQAGYMSELLSLCDRIGLSYSTPDGKIACRSLTLDSNSSRPQVEFAGPKFGSDLDSAYANCDALALVSHTENFGATVVDALAHSKPVITSTKTPWRIVAGGFGDVGRCGWWVENDVQSLSRAIVELMAASDAELGRLGRNGHSLVESRYTWQSVAKVVECAYEVAQHDCEFAPCGTCEMCYDTCSPARIVS